MGLYSMLGCEVGSHCPEVLEQIMNCLLPTHPGFISTKIRTWDVTDPDFIATWRKVVLLFHSRNACSELDRRLSSQVCRNKFLVKKVSPLLHQWMLKVLQKEEYHQHVDVHPYLLPSVIRCWIRTPMREKKASETPSPTSTVNKVPSRLYFCGKNHRKSSKVWQLKD